jgi:nitric oxide reductase activation protein
MDSGYDPATRYAQYDVRRANEENLRSGINAFCISTDENKIEDLEIMFPARHYVIIKSMETLPETLSKLYLKITA